MKVFKIAIFGSVIGLLSIFLVPHGVFAADSDLVKTVDGSQCLDLEAAYAEINNSSKALTNVDNGVDAVKKANTLATLTNIASFFVGDSLYCVKDKVAASKVTSFEQYGILGEISIANTEMLASFPTVNVGSHLAQMFVPGYKGNNSTYATDCTAESNAYGTCIQSHPTDTGACSTQYTAYTNCVNGTDASAGDATIDPQSYDTGSASTFENFLENQKTVITKPITDGLDSITDETSSATAVTVSGISYLKDTLHLDAIWNWSRNLAYLGYIVITIIIGFMIMFRKNLGGQTIVSIGNSIPNLVIGILLVTFSFAIVGLVLDLGKVGINVSQNMFANIAATSGNSELASEGVIKTDDPGTLFGAAFKASSSTGSKIFSWLAAVPLVGSTLVTIFQSKILTALPTMLPKLGNVMEGIVAGLFTANGITDTQIKTAIPGADAIVSVIQVIANVAFSAIKYGLIAALVKLVLIALICLFGAFKLFITILTTYFKIFVNVVLAPIQILIGSLPGNSGMIVSWFKSVVANVLVFVGIVFVVNFFNYIATIVDPSQFNFFGNTGVVWPNWLIPLKGVIVIAGYFFASSLPGVINGLLKVEQSREMSAAGMDIKKAASKIPLIGGIFNS